MTPRYVNVYCDTARRLDIARGVVRGEYPYPSSMGMALAERIDERWMCLCCGEFLRVVW